MKTRKCYTRTVGDVAFTSYESQKDANEQAETHIVGAYTDSASCFAPELIVYRGWAELIWRTIDGYARKTERNPAANAEYYPTFTRFNNCSSEYETYHKAKAAALMNLAQNAYKHEDGTESEVLRGPFSAAPEYDNLRADFARWATFQIRYRHFSRLGYAAHTCHAMACDERVLINESDLTPIVLALLERVDETTRNNYRRGLIDFEEVQSRAEALKIAA